MIITTNLPVVGSLLVIFQLEGHVMKKGKRINGTGSIWKRNKNFVWQYYDAVIRKSVAKTIRDKNGIPVKTKADAEKIVAELQKELFKAQSIESKAEYLSVVAEAKKLISRERKIRISDIWQEYLSNSSRPDSGAKTLLYYQSAVTAFTNWLLEKHSEISTVDEITEKTANEFSSFCWKSGISERRYNGIIGTLKLVFKIIRRNEDNPFESVKKKIEQKQRKEAFTLEQLKAISKTVDSPSYYMLYKSEMRLLLLLMLYTGARLEDACLMSWESIDFKKRLITFIPSKTARRKPVPVIIPIASVLYDELSKIADKHKECHVIPDVAKRYFANASGISKDIVQLIEDSGIQTKAEPKGLSRKLPVVKYSAHSFRHTFCSLALNAGMPLTAVQSIVGHATPLMTQHYSHISLATKESIIKCLPSLAGSEKEEKPSFADSIEKLFLDKREKLIPALEKILSEEQKEKLLFLVG